MPLPRTLALGLLPALAAPAFATGTLTLEGSSARLTVEAFVGTAIVDAALPCVQDDTVDDCEVSGPLELPAEEARRTTPGRTGIAGSGWARAQESQWGASLALDWATWQDFALADVDGDTVLSASGRHDSALEYAVSGPGAFPSRLVTVRNFQRIGFTLDAATDFSMTGLVFGEYMPIQLYKADDADGLQLVGSWCPYEGVACEGGGTLGPGRYVAQVFEWANSDSDERYSFGWDYRFTFHDTVSAVPEAPPLAMLAAGLAAIGWRCRRRTAAD